MGVLTLSQVLVLQADYVVYFMVAAVRHLQGRVFGAIVAAEEGVGVTRHFFEGLVDMRVLDDLDFMEGLCEKYGRMCVDEMMGR